MGGGGGGDSLRRARKLRDCICKSTHLGTRDIGDSTESEMMVFISSLFYSFTFFQRHIHSMICKLGKVLNNKHLLFGVGNGSLENQCPGLTCESSRVGLVWTVMSANIFQQGRAKLLFNMGARLLKLRRSP